MRWNIIKIGQHNAQIRQQPSIDNKLVTNQKINEYFDSNFVSNNILNKQTNKLKRKQIKKTKKNPQLHLKPLIDEVNTKFTTIQNDLFDVGLYANVEKNLTQVDTTCFFEQKIKIQESQQQLKVFKIFKNKKGYSRNAIHLTRECILNDDKLYSCVVKHYQSKIDDFKNSIL